MIPHIRRVKGSILFLFLTPLLVWSQTDSLSKPRLHAGGYIEAYYNLDAGWPADHLRPCFLYNHHRTGEVNINLALAQLSLDGTGYRARLGLMAGTYAQANLAAEPAALRMLYEANVGLALDKQQRTWLDMGVFPSYIGFEGPIGTDNWTLSRSLCAENSPYYLAGLRIQHRWSDRWEASAYLLNGWQRIRMQRGHTIPSLGTQLRFQANDKLLLNWSTFLGTDSPDSSFKARLFSNLYTTWQPTERWGFTLGLDLGMQQRSSGSAKWQAWASPVLIARYAFHPRWNVVGRIEHYNDPNQAIVNCQYLSPNNKVALSSASLGLDYKPNPILTARLETRWLHDPQATFLAFNTTGTSNLCLSACLAARIP